MKRYSGLHDKLCTIENIEVADDNARKNKNKKYGINKHDKNRQFGQKVLFIIHIVVLKVEVFIFVLIILKEI